MAKPMLVTLPFALLLLDFWPLRRVEIAGGGPWAAFRRGWPDVWRLVREKVPLMILAAGACVVTFLAQQRGGAFVTAAPVSARLGNAAVSYLAYIGKMLWPFRLAAFYPPRMLSAWNVSIGVVLLIGITILAVRAGQRHGFFLAGWLWYLGTLVPVIGVVQVGEQAMADRYTYIPLIGLFLIAAWGLPVLLEGWQRRSVALSVVAVGVLALFAGLARAQVPYWNDGITLWRHALEATENNHVANSNLGGLLVKQGREAEAVPYLAEAIRLRPAYPEALNFMGIALMYQGKIEQAAGYFDRSLRVRPDSPLAQYNLGATLMYQGKLDEAASHFAETLRLSPGFADAHKNLARILAGRGEFDAAITEYKAALRLKPEYADAHNDLGTVLARQGRIDEAIEHFTEALRIQPGFEDASKNLRLALSIKGANKR
jgi:tetratricopeptide (TPR) repeat protein